MYIKTTLKYIFSILMTSVMFIGIVGLPAAVFAKMEKPTLTAEDFFRFIRAKRFEDASDLLSANDKRSFKRLKAKLKKAGKLKKGMPMELGDILSDQYFLVHGHENKKMLKKISDGETIVPEKVGFFVPGQYYIVGNYAVVFTRETYELAHDNTGPVRDDPRKLWIDPTNDLSKVRDEAYFKQWWEWEKDWLTMPGVIWMVKERNEWKIEMFSGTVPKKAFRGVMKWHFGRDVFEEPKPKEEAPKQEPNSKEKSKSASGKNSTSKEGKK